MTATATLEILHEPDPRLHHVILQGIRGFNRMLFPDHPDGIDLAIAVRDPPGQAPVGGLLGRLSGGWLGIELLFVPESLRGHGVATRLITMAEEEAKRQGCHSAWLDTLNPKAKALYERLGYTVFGELDNYPVGFSRFFLRKSLDALR